MVGWPHRRDRDTGDSETSRPNESESVGKRASSTRRHYLQTLGAITAGAGLAGETTQLANAERTSWPQFGYDTANTGHAPENRAPVVNAAKQWEAANDATSGSVPVVADGRLFVTVEDNVYGYNLEDGVTGGDWSWRLRGENAVGSTPTVVDGTAYVGLDKDIRAVSIEGNEGWTHVTEGRIETSPVVADGVVYAGSRDENGRLHARDATDGSEVWTHQTWSPIRSSPAVADGTVYVGNDYGNVYAIDTASGERRWTYRDIPEPIRSAVVVGDGRIFVADGAGVLHAIRDGSADWSRDLGVPVGVSPAVADGTVYVPDSDGTLYALDIGDGRNGWTASIDSPGTTPVVASGTVFVGTNGGTVHAFETVDGAERYAADAGSPVLSAPSVADGWLYVLTEQGIAAFSEFVSAAFEYEPSNPKTGQTITFDASSSGPDQLISSYEWSIGGQQATGETVQATFDDIDNYTVAVTVTGENGLTDTTEQLIPVSGQAPTAAIEHTPSEPIPNETVTFSAAPSTDPDGEIVSYQWLIGTESKSGEQIEHTFDRAGEFHVQLTVEDETGKTDTVQQRFVVSEPTPTEPTPTPTPTEPTPTPTPTEPAPTNDTDSATGVSESSEDEWVPIGAGALTTLTGIAGWLHFGRDVPEDVHGVDSAENGQPVDDEPPAQLPDDESESENE